MISEVSLHPANKRGSPSKPQIIPSTNHETILKEQWQQSADKHRSEIAELSPDERYVRFHDVITKTNNVQISYKAFDTINGVEIAWHKISMSSFQQSDYDKFVSCINIVNSLHCENIVEYQATWFSNYLNKRINQSDVVTESGGVAYGDGYEFLNIITTHLESLSEFIGKVKTLKWKIIKKWCRHVLQGLQVLHYQEKPIVHGNLSCSHIYIDGTSGKITIGDIWLSTVLGISHPIESAFRAKELTGNNAPVDSKVDIYSFGMTVLEMISKESSSLSLGSTSGSQNNLQQMGEQIEGNVVKSPIGDPDFFSVLSRVKNDQAVSFVKSCFSPPDRRPSATELLLHEFLTSDAMNDEQVVLVALPKIKSKPDLFNMNMHSNVHPTLQDASEGSVPACSAESLSMHTATTTSLHDKRFSTATEVKLSQLVKLISISRVAANSSDIFMQISISASLFADKSAAQDKEVEFAFDSINENIENVIEEMVLELDLNISVKDLALLVGSFVESFFQQTQSLQSTVDKTQSLALKETTCDCPQSPTTSVATTTGTTMRDISNISSPSIESSPSMTIRQGYASQTISRQSSIEGSDIAMTSNHSEVSTPSKLVARSSAMFPTMVETSNEPRMKTTENDKLEPKLANTLETTEKPENSSSEQASDKVLFNQPCEGQESDSSSAKSNPEQRTDSMHKTFKAASELNPADFADDLILQKMLEKIDQEARAARRAFETRIQKLLSIQEICRVELQTLKTDFQIKTNDFNKKVETVQHKKNQDIQKLTKDFEEAVKNLRTKLIDNIPSGSI